jgi:Protein of unknown function (DUF4089)
MKSEDDFRRYVLETADLIGLPLAPGDLPGVIAVFMNLARVSGPLMAFPLVPDKISASIFSAYELGEK